MNYQVLKSYYITISVCHRIATCADRCIVNQGDQYPPFFTLARCIDRTNALPVLGINPSLLDVKFEISPWITWEGREELSTAC